MSAPVETVGPNAWVAADYQVTDDAGTVLDSSDDSGPMEFVFGYGAVLPALESELFSMRIGEEKMVSIAAHEGFGEHDPSLVFTVERNELPNGSEVAVGDEFDFVLPNGETDAVVRVTEVTGDQVRCDANHPLAGRTLAYRVRIKSLRDATEAEIAAAAETMDDDEAWDELEEPGVSSPPESGLVKLRKK